jgi:GDP-D-mannose dehydratase
MNVFIMGMTGRTGSRIAQLLISQAHAVTGLYRREGDVSKLLRMAARGIPGDIAADRVRHNSGGFPLGRGTGIP